MRQVCAHEGIKIFLNGFFFLKHWASVIIFINHSLVWGNWLYGKKATIVLCWSCDEYDQKQLRIPLMSCSKFPLFSILHSTHQTLRVFHLSYFKYILQISFNSKLPISLKLGRLWIKQLWWGKQCITSGPQSLLSQNHA